MRSLVATPGVAGVDEAGRGTLAGPVVVAAVLLPEGFEPGGIRDSKQLTPGIRALEAERIREHAQFTVVTVGHTEVDSRGVLAATLIGMTRALEQLLPLGGHAIVDGNQKPGWKGFLEAKVRGDSVYLSIAAASLLAKTERDRQMADLHREYPQYGFNAHKGYCTAAHLAALRQYGPCPAHRRTFAPVREITEQRCLILEA